MKDHSQNPEMRRALEELWQDRAPAIAIEEFPDSIVPGDSFLFEATINEPVQWVVVLEDPDFAELYFLVGADEFSMVGACDVELPTDHTESPLALRCGVGVWAHRNELKTQHYFGRIESYAVADARERLAEMLYDEVPTKALGENVDADVDYREWIDSLLALAARIEDDLVRMQEANDQREKFNENGPAGIIRFAAEKFKHFPAQTLGAAAAVLLILGVAGYSIWMSAGPNSVANERQAVAKMRLGPERPDSSAPPEVHPGDRIAFPMTASLFSRKHAWYLKIDSAAHVVDASSGKPIAGQWVITDRESPFTILAILTSDSSTERFQANGEHASTVGDFVSIDRLMNVKPNATEKMTPIFLNALQEEFGDSDFDFHYEVYRNKIVPRQPKIKN